MKTAKVMQGRLENMGHVKYLMRAIGFFYKWGVDIKDRYDSYPQLLCKPTIQSRWCYTSCQRFR